MCIYTLSLSRGIYIIFRCSPQKYIQFECLNSNISCGTRHPRHHPRMLLADPGGPLLGGLGHMPPRVARHEEVGQQDQCARGHGLPCCMSSGIMKPSFLSESSSCLPRSCISWSLGRLSVENKSLNRFKRGPGLSWPSCIF
jgi:hypothetical protein